MLNNPMANVDPLGLLSNGLLADGDNDDDGSSICNDSFFYGVCFAGSGGSSAGGGGGGGGSRAPNNGQVPVHGIWHYGNYCGAGGMGTPTNAVDSACMQHDACFGNSGADWTNMQSQSNWNQLSPGQQTSVQSCNQNLCNAMTTINPTIPWWNVGEQTADWEINAYFHGHVPAGAQCH